MTIVLTKAEKREWAAAVRDEPFRDFVLAELRNALRRAKLYVNEIEALGVALAGGIITAETALACLHAAGALEFVKPADPPEMITDALIEATRPVNGSEKP